MNFNEWQIISLRFDGNLKELIRIWIEGLNWTLSNRAIHQQFYQILNNNKDNKDLNRSNCTLNNRAIEQQFYQILNNNKDNKDLNGSNWTLRNRAII